MAIGRPDAIFDNANGGKKKAAGVVSVEDLERTVMLLFYSITSFQHFTLFYLNHSAEYDYYTTW